MKRLSVSLAMLALYLAQGVLSINAQTKSAIDKNKTLGNPAAPVVVELFHDFENPHCRNIYKDWVPRLTKDFITGGKMYLIFREYPSVANPYSKLAAVFAVAAARVGKYDHVADVLFDNQQSWATNGKIWETVATVLTPAEQKKVQALAKDPGVLGEVEGDVQRARTTGITQAAGTLITYKSKQLNFNNWYDYKSFAAYINSLLKY